MAAFSLAYRIRQRYPVTGYLKGCKVQAMRPRFHVTALCLALSIAVLPSCSRNEASLWMLLSEDAHIEDGNKAKLSVDVKNTKRPEPDVVELSVKIEMERPTVSIVHRNDHSRILWPSYSQIRYRQAINCPARLGVVREVEMYDSEGRQLANPPDLQQMIAGGEFRPIADASNEELLWRSACSGGTPR